MVSQEGEGEEEATEPTEEAPLGEPESADETEAPPEDPAGDQDPPVSGQLLLLVIHL